MIGLKRNLRDLQASQLEHDRRAHKQVLCWPFQRRVTHFSLHFAKYQATLLTTDPVRDSGIRRRVLTDSFIIAMAAANTLDLELPSSNVEALNSHDLLISYVVATGKMAKACEAMDHGEPFDFRDALEISVAALASLTRALARLERIDLVASTRERWSEVEEAVATASTRETSTIEKKTAAYA